MAYLSYIVTIVAIVLASIFALLLKVRAGFAYFVLTTLLLLSLFWGAWLIFKYLTEYKKELEEQFKLFKAKTINNRQLSVEYFDENIAVFKKEFSKKTKKDRFVKWFIILFCFACAVAFLLGMIFY